ncbi:reverse transcriptase, partial [Globisporangium splendens]
MLWRYMSASLIHAIWCAHLRRMDSDPIESTAEMAIMMTRLEAGMRNLTRLAEAQAGDSDGHTFAAVLKGYVDCFLSQTDAIPLTPNDTRGVYLLFFDGGSRGNPGPGGTGSIIVHVHKDSHTASLIWAASMAYSRKDTTNNFAEYWGLIHGLREAQRSHFEPLYVIGDSALIISQQRMHRSPRQRRLERLYQTSRRLADCIDIRGWYHHYRAFNKMADSAANLAMDTRTSTQVHFPTQRAAFNNLTQDLDNDVMHWLMRSSEDPSGVSSDEDTKTTATTERTEIRSNSKRPLGENKLLCPAQTRRQPTASSSLTLNGSTEEPSTAKVWQKPSRGDLTKWLTPGDLSFVYANGKLTSAFAVVRPSTPYRLLAAASGTAGRRYLRRKVQAPSSLVVLQTLTQNPHANRDHTQQQQQQVNESDSAATGGSNSPTNPTGSEPHGLGIGSHSDKSPLQYCKHQAPVPPKEKTPHRLWNAIGGEDRRLIVLQRNNVPQLL